MKSSNESSDKKEKSEKNSSDDSYKNHLHCYLCKCSDPDYLVYSEKDDFYLCTNGPEKLKGSHLLFVLDKYGSVPLHKVIYSKTTSELSDDDNDNDDTMVNNDKIIKYSIIDSENNQKITYTLYKEKYIPIICNKCKNNNIYDLGFVRQEKKKKATNINYENGNLDDIENIKKSFENICCISCLFKEFGSKSKIIRSFNPIICYNSISELIVSRLQDKSLITSYLLPLEDFRNQIKAIRELRNYKVRQIDQIALKPLKLHYKNPENYINSLLPFINEEENVSNSKTLSEKFFDIPIEIEIPNYNGSNNESLLTNDFYNFSFYAYHTIFTAMVPGSRVSIKHPQNSPNGDDDAILGIVLGRDPKTSYVKITITKGSLQFKSNSVIYDKNIKNILDDGKTEYTKVYYFTENVNIFRRPTDIPFARQREALTKFKKNNFFIRIMSGDLRLVNKRTNGIVEPFIKEIEEESKNKSKEDEEDRNDANNNNNDEEEENIDDNDAEDDDFDDNDEAEGENESKVVDDEELKINNLIQEINEGCNMAKNDDQIKAVKFALLHKFAMIQGPPGTGKSTCIAVQALAYFKMDKTVLIVTHSNTAADHIASIIQDLTSRLNMRASEVVVRVCGSTYEPIADSNLSMRPILLTNLVEGFRKDNHFNQKKFIKNNHRIYIATAITSGGSRLDRLFERVIVDESNQLVDTELLVPLTRGCKQLTLYGDHKQIGPFVYSNKCKENNFALSFIERLPKLGYKPICLETQYRMHPQISLFPSMAFYGNRLKNGVTAEDRLFEADDILLPHKDIPVVFYNVKNSLEQYSPNGKSFLNVAEASTLGEIISKFKNFQPRIRPEQLAVITFYNGMIDVLRSNLRYLSSDSKNGNDDDFYDRININTVDAFEGSDIDYVILICVRSNKKKNIGFLSDMGRLNVALTRAKRALFIIGNETNLSSNETWAELIKSLKDRDVLYNI